MSDSNETWILKTFFSKNTQMSNFTKIRPEEVKLLHVDGQTDGRTDKRKITNRHDKVHSLFFFNLLTYLKMSRVATLIAQTHSGGVLVPHKHKNKLQDLGI
jgi:hypothetical protein